MTPQPLIGRTVELARVERLLAASQADAGAVLVVRGPAGIGKSALLDFAVARAGGRRVLRIRGIAAESDLRYAALQPLCSLLLGGPAGSDPSGGPQPGHREILEIVVGLRSGAAPGPAETAAALTTWLASAAASQSILCVVDDAQWLDFRSHQAIEELAHRLTGVPVALLVADRGDGFADMPELRVGGLDRADARRLWESASHVSIDETLLERILMEAQGTPRALLESAWQACGPDAAVTTGFGEHPELAQAPDSRMLLILAAAEPLGDPGVLARAAARLGIDATAAQHSESAGWLAFGERVAFCDPVQRTSTYRLATVAERRRAHTALAAATDPAAEPDRRAWHLALAHAGPNDALAANLARWASTALDRGGATAAAALLEQAALSTADPELRAERAVAAAAAHRTAGAFETAAALLAMAELGPADDAREARIALLRAGIAFDRTRTPAAATLLLRAAREAVAREAVAPHVAFDEALTAEVLTGGVDAARLIRRWTAEHPRDDASVLFDRLVRRCIEGPSATIEPWRPTARPSPLSCIVAADQWDDESWHDSTDRLLEQSRRLGMRAALPQALAHRAVFEVHAGRFDTARALVDEAASLSNVIGTPPFDSAAAILAAWRGLQEDPTLDPPRRRWRPGDGVAAGIDSCALAVFYNGIGEYEKAADATLPVLDGDGMDALGLSLTELVEAAVRSGDRGTAEAALARLTARTRLSGTDWALGVAARSQALLHDGEAAEDLYIEAIERLRRCRIRTHQARAELSYGEWLRRRGRRVDARIPLRSAYQAFSDMGAAGFAERARRELLATSERARRRTEDTRAVLTPHERQVAVLARDGRSNPQIAALLSISPRTVEYHLHKVFGKLGISSRAELRRVLCPG